MEEASTLSDAKQRHNFLNLKRNESDTISANRRAHVLSWHEKEHTQIMYLRAVRRALHVFGLSFGSKHVNAVSPATCLLPS